MFLKHASEVTTTKFSYLRKYLRFKHIILVNKYVLINVT
jgi:hypothetical protein